MDWIGERGQGTLLSFVVVVGLLDMGMDLQFDANQKEESLGSIGIRMCSHHCDDGRRQPFQPSPRFSLCEHPTSREGDAKRRDGWFLVLPFLGVPANSQSGCHPVLIVDCCPCLHSIRLVRANWCEVWSWSSSHPSRVRNPVVKREFSFVGQGEIRSLLIIFDSRRNTHHYFYNNFYNNNFYHHHHAVYCFGY